VFVPHLLGERVAHQFTPTRFRSRSGLRPVPDIWTSQISGS
jgi:hypothetical protein